MPREPSSDRAPRPPAPPPPPPPPVATSGGLPPTDQVTAGLTPPAAGGVSAGEWPTSASFASSMTTPAPVDHPDWYEELLRAGRAVQLRRPWYRRIFTRSDRADAPTRRRARDLAPGPTPRAGSVSSEGARSTLATVMGLVVVSGLAVSVAPGTADDGRTPQAAEVAVPAVAPKSVVTEVPSTDAGAEAGSATRSDRGVVPPLPVRGPDLEPAPAPATASDALTDGPTDAAARGRPWVAVVERLDADSSSRQDAVDRSMTLTVLGVAAEVMASEDLGLEPGAWLLVTGPFGTADQAVGSCADRAAAPTCEPVRRFG